MDTEEIIALTQNTEKKIPVKVYLKERKPVAFPDRKVFGIGSRAIFGGWKVIESILKENTESIKGMVTENNCRNSTVPLLDKRYINTRAKPRVVIRDQVKIGDNAVIMMGAIINIGATIGEGTMIDTGTVLGGRAAVGKHYHISAGVIPTGAIKPASAVPVVVEDDVLIGASAIVIEGVYIGKNAVVTAGAVVIEDVPANSMVVGCPACVIKEKDAEATGGTELAGALRSL